jgi:glycosyltransferase involved in cell wall biosynthesis
MLHTVTIIVPTRNEAHNIGPFLDSIPSHLRLIVVDASDDETPHLILTRRPQATQVLCHAANVTEARQIGAEAATTTWLLFTDADITFAPDYFTRLPRYLGLGYGALYGATASQTAYQAYYHWFSRGQALADSFGIPAVSGSNLLIRRDVFQAIGGFDLRLTCNEDSEIGWRVKRQGYWIRFVPQLLVYAHDHRRLVQQGQIGKTVHSLLRCALLWSGLMPPSWRQHDWGYWSNCRHDRLQKDCQVLEDGSR